VTSSEVGSRTSTIRTSKFRRSPRQQMVEVSRDRLLAHGAHSKRNRSARASSLEPHSGLDFQIVGEVLARDLAEEFRLGLSVGLLGFHGHPGILAGLHTLNLLLQARNHLSGTEHEAEGFPGPGTFHDVPRVQRQRTACSRWIRTSRFALSFVTPLQGLAP
jgi:hypothetical protein